MSEETTYRPAWSDQVDKLWPAVAQARAAMPEIEKTATSEVKKKGTDKTIYTVKYIPLPALIEAVKEALHEAGLFWWFTTEATENGKTRGVSYITHTESGQWFRSEFILPAPPDSWGAGSFLTFMRRYLLLAQLGMQPFGEDDEGKAAQRGHREAERSQRAADEAETARAQTYAARKRDYAAAVKAGSWGGYDEANAAALTFVKSAFGAPDLAGLPGDRFGLVCEFLSLGGELPPDSADDPLLSDDTRQLLAEWMGRGGASEADSERMALLRAACGPDTAPEDGIAWAKDTLQEDPLEMAPGARLDTVRLYLYLGGHPVLGQAVAKLGKGDPSSGVSKLWKELGAADLVLASGPADLVAKLEGVVGDD